MQPGIKVNLPKTRTADVEDTTNIEILLCKDGSVYIKGKQIEYSNLGSVLKDLAAKNPNSPVLIKGDKEVRYGFVADVVSEARMAGLSKFVLAVEVNKDKK
jgi:biopolymer transport protein ExbD